MNKDIVSFETAKILKEKGFSNKCCCAYDRNSKTFFDKNEKNYNELSFAFSAPLLFDAQKWLREKHDIHIPIDWGMDGYDFAITKKDEDGLFIEESYHEYYETYEKCLDNAIRAALSYVIYSESLDGDNKCLYCNSYKDGWCTNFGKEVNAEDSCKHYQCDIVEYTCQQCGRKYQYSDSDATCRDKFCCKACEYGY